MADETKHLYGCPYFSNHQGDPFFCACDKAREQFAAEDRAKSAAETKKEVGRGVRPKYVDEHFPRWMKWGGWMPPNEKIGDVSDCNATDVVSSVSEEVADKLVKARDEFVDRLQEIFDEHPDQFHVYGPPIK